MDRETPLLSNQWLVAIRIGTNGWLLSESELDNKHIGGFLDTDVFVAESNCRYSSSFMALITLEDFQDFAPVNGGDNIDLTLISGWISMT